MAVPVKCDIIIAGGGMAGLSLLYRATKSGLWRQEKIIVIDWLPKTENDRTWSFWNKGKSDFGDLISHRWTDLTFYAHSGEKISLQSGDYQYNSIHSIDLYQHVHAWLADFPNISFVEDELITMNSVGGLCQVTTRSANYESTYVFNSIYRKPALLSGEQYFLQHFKGLRIKTSALIPAINEACLMDFRTGQEQGTTFFYTLPMAADELFVEYTLFSKQLLQPEDYDRELRHYIRSVLQIEQYEILSAEFGAIPMTDHQFKRFEGNIIHIGSQGGDTRASTGYTFTNTQKTIASIVQSILHAGHPFFRTEAIGLKANLYDATLLNVLNNKTYEGYQLFYDLFRQTPAHRIFAFLDAESSLFSDLHIMSSLRVFPFLRAFIAALKRRFFSRK